MQSDSASAAAPQTLDGLQLGNSLGEFGARLGVVHGAGVITQITLGRFFGFHHRRFVEIFRASQIKQAATFNFTPYIATALVFVVVTIPLARLTDRLVERERKRRSAGGVR